MRSASERQRPLRGNRRVWIIPQALAKRARTARKAQKAPRSEEKPSEVHRKGSRAKFIRTCDSSAGFTLLEVMAAVALLGAVYTVLGGAGIQGLQHEGESRRRIEASLIADQLIAGLETSIDAGTVPPVGKDERQEGVYRIATEVAPLDLVVPDDPAPLQGLGGGGQSGLGGSNLPAALSQSLLKGSSRAPSPIRRITLRISWTEGWGERSVTRTTFGFDAESVQAEVSALAGIAASEAQQDQSAAPQTSQTPQAPAQGNAPQGNPVR
jgi:prepilin-type N-terminal cleavage/methylation domain-containing protein